MAGREIGWSSDWAETHGANESEEIYEEPARFERYVEQKTSTRERALLQCLSWRRQGRAHFIRMLVCAALSLIPGCWWMLWAAGAFAVAWLFCSYKFFTTKLD